MSAEYAAIGLREDAGRLRTNVQSDGSCSGRTGEPGASDSGLTGPEIFASIYLLQTEYQQSNAQAVSQAHSRYPDCMVYGHDRCHQNYHSVSSPVQHGRGLQQRGDVCSCEHEVCERLEIGWAWTTWPRFLDRPKLQLHQCIARTAVRQFVVPETPPAATC